MLSTLIIEDEKKSRELLRELLEQYCSNAEVVGEAASVKEAKELINQCHPKLVFLDVEMRDGTGFDLLKQLGKIDFKIIFVTAHAHYAIKAIRFSAVDYLLKPIDADELKEAVNKAEGEMQNDHSHHINGFLTNLESQESSRLAVPIKDGVAFLEPHNIIRLEADGTYTHIYTTQGKYTAIKNLKEYEEMLLNFNFFRSHHSHLINLKHVKAFNRMEGFFATMSDGTSVEISRRKKGDFLKVMHQS